MMIAASIAGRAQSLEPFNPYGVVSPAAESWRMSKYGGITPSLFTGAMTYSVPVYNYSDTDFEVPVSLDYNFDGYRPAVHSGTVGYGWFLNCGGVITREVRGLPDDDWYLAANGRTMCGYYRSIHDGYSTASTTYNSTVNYQTFCNSLCAVYLSESTAHTFDPYNTFPTQVHTVMNNGVPTSLDNSHYDMTPDIYHFNVMGHSGDFMFMPDGTIRVFNSDIPYGEISVEFNAPESGRSSSNPLIAGFTLTMGNGTKYVFGGGVNAIEYAAFGNSVTINSGAYTLAASAFRLSRIVSPSGRSLNFNYSSTRQISRTLSPYYTLKYQSTGYSSPSNLETSYSYSFYPILESISVSDGGTIMTFEYENKTQNEGSASYYSVGTFPSLASGVFSVSSSSLRLKTITVRNASGETVEKATLTQTYASSGTPKMFLQSVSTMAGGKHQFSYDLSGRTLPNNDTRSTDHWGWWNGKTPGDMRTIAVFSGSRYNQISGNSKDPDVSYAKAGALTTITYPTGGTSTIVYEGNSAASGLEEEGQIYTPNQGGSIAVGGTRVKSITNRPASSAAAETTTYSYTDGFLFHMPRYKMEVPLVYHYAQSNTTVGFEDPLQNATNVTWNVTVTAYNQDCDYSVSRDGIIGYGNVSAAHPDGSFTRTYFNTYSGDCCDRYNDPFMFYLVAKRGLFSYLDQLDCGTTSTGAPYTIMPCSDRRNMRGTVSSIKEYDASSSLVRTETFSYTADVVSLNWIYYNNIESFIRQPWECRSPLLTSKTVTDYHDDGRSISTTSTIVYNNRGQKSKVTETGPAGSVHNTYYQYLHETQSGSVLPGAVLKVVKTAGTSGSEFAVDAVKYEYASSSTHIKPSKAIRYLYDNPVSVSSVSTALSSMNSLPSQSATFTYDSRLRLTNEGLPGAAYVTYVWSGNNVISKTVNGTTNKTTYTWKDMVGPTGIVPATGAGVSYTYDSKGRLEYTKDADGKAISVMNYKLKNE